MSTPSGVPQAPVSAGGVEGQAAVIGEVAKEMYSLRFDGSSYLQKNDFSSYSNQYTFSVWAKIIPHSGGGYFFSTAQNHGFSHQPDAANAGLLHYWNGSPIFDTAGKYRDYSAWYHIVFSVINAANVNVYINGDLVVAHSGTTGSINSFGGSVINRIGAWHNNPTAYNLTGYIANIHFIDGESLEPSAFGELISDVWRPASYSGDYGVNGFHLDFDPDNMIYDSNGKLTQVKDASGNDNHWTAN